MLHYTITSRDSIMLFWCPGAGCAFMQWHEHPTQASWNESHFPWPARNYSAERTEYQFVQLQLNSDSHTCAHYYEHAHALPFDVSISVAYFHGFLLHWWTVIHSKHLFLQPFMTLLIFCFTISFYQLSYCKCHASQTNFSFLFINADLHYPLDRIVHKLVDWKYLSHDNRTVLRNDTMLFTC